MGVYIRDMKIPSKCIECRLMHRCGKDDLDYVCMPARVYVEDLTNAYKPRPEWCPLVRVPPHSDLIDRDKLREKEFINNGDAYAVVMSRDIRNAATIIPAEESNMDSFIHIFEEDDEEDGMDSFIRILKD